MRGLKLYVWQVCYALAAEVAMLGAWFVAMGFGVEASNLWWLLLICVGMVALFAGIYYFLHYLETKLISLLAMVGVGIGSITTLFRAFGGWVENLVPHGFFQWAGIFLACLVLAALLGMACSIFLKLAYRHLLRFELFYVVVSLLIGTAIFYGAMAVLNGAMQCSVALFVVVILAVLAGFIAGFGVDVRGSALVGENGEVRMINKFFSESISPTESESAVVEYHEHNKVKE